MAVDFIEYFLTNRYTKVLSTKIGVVLNASFSYEDSRGTAKGFGGLSRKDKNA